METSSWSDHRYLSVILAVGLSILLKIFLSEEKISLFGLGAFLLVRKGI
jgi:hypothetical protein